MNEFTIICCGSGSRMSQSVVQSLAPLIFKLTLTQENDL